MRLSCARAGTAATARTSNAAKIPATRFILALHACSRAPTARKSGVGDVGLRQAEAPFRQSLGRRTVGRDVAIGHYYSRPRGSGKALKTLGLRLGVGQVQHA